MITIKICEYERQFNGTRDIDEQWINQQINRRKDSGQPVFVRVIIQQGDINISLATPGFPGGRVGTPRPLKPMERAVVDLWNKRGTR